MLSSSTRNSIATTSPPQRKLARSLSLSQVVVIGLAYLTPMTVFDSFVIVSQKTSGHVPSAYILALVIMLLTAVSYGKLAKRFPQAGSAYTYVQKSIGNRSGFMIGWLSLLDYILLPMVNALLARIYLEALFPEVAGWIWVTVFVILITLINLRSVNWVAHVNLICVLIQVTMMVVFVLLVWRGLAHGQGVNEGFTIVPFYSAQLAWVPIISGATVLCFSFLGFDAVSTLSEEVKQPERVIPRAIFLIALYGGIIFVLVSYFIQVYFPNQSQLSNPDNALPEIALFVGGKLFQSMMLCCTLVGVFASGIACQTSVSRLLFAMGRDRVFPQRLFGYLHPEWKTPIFNTLFVGVIALSAIYLDLETAMSLINFGALVAFTFVNLAVIRQFYYRERLRTTKTHHFQYLVLPVIGVLGIGMLWLNLSWSALVLGVSWGAMGVLYMGYKTGGFRRNMPTMHDTHLPMS